MATTTVRYLFGLPFALLYLCWLNSSSDYAQASFSATFFSYAIVGSVAQIMATAALVKAFQFRNFAVATSFAKTEAILTAVIGTLIFHSALSLAGWLGVVIGAIGTLLISYKRFSLSEIWQNPSARYGLASGLGFAVTSLSLREASLSLETNAMYSAAITLAIMVSLQTLICCIWLRLKDGQQYTRIRAKFKPSLFVGLTSAVGSVGWFTAMSLENAALVKTLGQVEFFITLLITYRIFKERISIREYWGMSLIIVSVLILLRF